MPMNVLALAIAKGMKQNEDGYYTLDAVVQTGFPFFSGCQCCGASLGPAQAYPSTSGYIRCKDCIDDSGFDTLADFEAFDKAKGGET